MNFLCCSRRTAKIENSSTNENRNNNPQRLKTPNEGSIIDQSPRMGKKPRMSRRASIEIGALRQHGSVYRMKEVVAQGDERKVVCSCMPKIFRLRLQKFTEHLLVQTLMAMLVLIDGVLHIVVLTNPDDLPLKHTISIVSQVILWILTVDVLLRLFYKDIYFFTDIWCLFDLLVIGFCIALEFIFEPRLKFIVFLRELRFIRIIGNFCRVNRRVGKSAKMAVSGSRRRYTKDGFDLDITYITKKLLAMSVPAVGKESVYRNPSAEVARFFKKKYNHRFHIYNLVPERKYDYSKFNNEVYEYFMEDHNPAPIPFIIAFLHDITAWFEKNEINIAAVHCKGGKGRTGTMVCAYLLFSQYCVDISLEGNKELNLTIETAEDALSYFAFRRTDDDGDSEGVEARSQTRYVKYIEKLLDQLSKSGRPYSELKPPKGRKVEILKIRVFGIKAIIRMFGIPKYIISANSPEQISTGILPAKYHGSGKDCKTHPADYIDYADFIPSEPVYVENDVKTSFYLERKKELFFGFWFHTYFEKGIRNFKGDLIYKFEYAVVDGIRHAIKQKEYKNAFPHYFECHVHYRDVIE